MKNKEKYAKELVDIVIEEWRFALNKDEKIVSCTNIMCSDCLFNARGGCISERIAWANAEYVEPKRFTEHEILFIMALPHIRYVARNEDGMVWAYECKPERKEECFSAEHALFPVTERVFGFSFKSVKWEDAEPTSREEILGK